MTIYDAAMNTAVLVVAVALPIGVAALATTLTPWFLLFELIAIPWSIAGFALVFET